MNTIERLAGQIAATDADGCWTWVGWVARNGYGVASWNGRKTTAHRAVYQALVGPIPEGMVVDHLCHNTVCVNPAHLEPVTQSVNLLRARRPDYAQRRAIALARPCPQGHERTPENVAIRHGKLACIPCGRQASLAHWRRKNGKSA